MIFFGSVVEKETDDTTGKEELQLKSVKYLLDEEEEEDPQLKQPGCGLH